MFNMMNKINSYMSEGKKIDKAREEMVCRETNSIMEQQKNLMKYMLEDTLETVNLFK